MGILKVIKSKVFEYRQEMEEINRLRIAGDITQFFKDTSNGSEMLAIQSIIITGSDTFTHRGRSGSHAILESDMVGQIICDKLSKMNGYFAQLVARECGYVVVEMAGFVNGGLTVMFTPEILNDYQISEIERIYNEIELWNNNTNEDCFKAKALILDPDTKQETKDILAVAQKYRARLEELNIEKNNSI